LTKNEINPVAPYSLELTVGAFGRFPDERVDVLFQGSYRRAFQDASGAVLFQVNQPETLESAPLTLTNIETSGSPDEDAHARTMQRLLAIDEPVEAVYRVMASETRLAWLSQRLRGLRRTIDPTPFEGLVSSILAQLISIRGAAVIRSRFVREFGKSLRADGMDYWTFPDPELVAEASVDQLCGLGMTQVKARAILEVARLSFTGELDLNELLQQSDSDVIRHLVSIPGVGPWTADWFLINVLGRMSIVPSGDLGIRRSAGNWLQDGTMPSASEVRTIYEPFGELRGYVAYYVLSAERYNLSPADID
jgi:DNA-3-methyladenine glycosylase II